MRFGLVSRDSVAVVAALSVALLVRVASAQTCPPAAECPVLDQPPRPATDALRLKIDAHGQPFDRNKLRAALARDLKKTVALTNGDSWEIHVDLQSPQHASVDYRLPTGSVITSGVDLPPDGEAAIQSISWLLVNFAQDDAAELLKELRARHKEQEATEAEAQRLAAEKAAAEKAAAQQAAADKAAADKAAADKAVADKAAADKARADSAKSGLVREPLLRDPWRSLDAAVATPLAALRDSHRRELHLQLALGYGESGAIRGAGVSLGMLRIRRDLQGTALGLGAVMVNENVRGIVVAGYSQVDGYLEGIQVGAGAALQRGPFARGAVLALGGALAGNLTGAVVGAGFASAKSLRGVGISGGATVIRGPSQGVLVAGGATSAAQHRGLEVAGGVNLARDLSGVAVAPINVHRRVKGLQIGVVNIAEEVDGAALGVISIAKNGRVQPVLWTSATDGSAHVAIKSVVGYMFTELGSGIDLKDSQLSFDGGLGAHLELGAGFFLEPCVHYSDTHGTKDTSGASDSQELHYLAQLGWRAGGKLDLLVAGGLRHTVSGGSGPAVAPEARAGIAFF